MRTKSRKQFSLINLIKNCTKFILFVLFLFIFFFLGLIFYPLLPSTMPIIGRVALIVTNILPFSGSSCPDFNTARSMMNNAWKDIDYGAVVQPFISNPYPKDMSVDDMGIQKGMGYDKWRYKDSEPYSGFITEGEWEFPFLKQSVKEISDGLYKGFIPLMQKAGFTFSKPNDIPYYLYPDGPAARKIVFTKNNYVYHFLIGERKKDYIASAFSIDKKKLPDHLSIIRMTCAKDESRLRAIYQKRFEYPHAWSNETAVLYRGRKNKVITFQLQYPGSSTNDTAYEYWADYGNKWELITATNTFINCSLMQERKIGRGMFCYLPSKNEFTVVDY